MHWVRARVGRGETVKTFEVAGSKLQVVRSRAEWRNPRPGGLSWSRVAKGEAGMKSGSKLHALQALREIANGAGCG